MGKPKIGPEDEKSEVQKTVMPQLRYSDIEIFGLYPNHPDWARFLTELSALKDDSVFQRVACSEESLAILRGAHETLHILNELGFDQSWIYGDEKAPYSALETIGLYDPDGMITPLAYAWIEDVGLELWELNLFHEPQDNAGLALEGAKSWLTSLSLRQPPNEQSSKTELESENLIVPINAQFHAAILKKSLRRFVVDNGLLDCPSNEFWPKLFSPDFSEVVANCVNKAKSQGVEIDYFRFKQEKEAKPDLNGCLYDGILQLQFERRGRPIINTTCYSKFKKILSDVKAEIRAEIQRAS